MSGCWLVLYRECFPTAQGILNAGEQFILATGGTESTFSDAGVTYKVHQFTSGGTLTVTSAPSGLLMDYLIVAGGGGGGQSSGGGAGGGGGGAGGLLTGTTAPSVTAYSIVVGAGGGVGALASNDAGTNGGDSSAFGLTSIGGGGGGGRNVAGVSGGSGGGSGSQLFSLVLALQDGVTMAVTEQSIVAHPVTTVAVAVVVRVRSVGRA